MYYSIKYYKIYEKINTSEKYEIFNKILKNKINLQNNKQMGK